MHKKNNIKYLLFYLASLLFGQGVFGFGLFWPVLMVLDDRNWVYWLGFVSGIFLSVFYGQILGPMSIFVVCVLAITHFMFSSGRINPAWLVLVSVLFNLAFDYFFGLGAGFWESVAVSIAAYFVARNADNGQVIKVNV